MAFANFSAKQAKMPVFKGKESKVMGEHSSQITDK